MPKVQKAAKWEILLIKYSNTFWVYFNSEKIVVTGFSQVLYYTKDVRYVPNH